MPPIGCWVLQGMNSIKKRQQKKNQQKKQKKPKQNKKTKTKKKQKTGSFINNVVFIFCSNLTVRFTYVWCCDWDKLPLLIIPLKILLIILSWYQLSLSTWFLIVFHCLIHLDGCSTEQRVNKTFLATCLVVRVLVQVLVSIWRHPIYQYRNLPVCCFN